MITLQVILAAVWVLWALTYSVLWWLRPDANAMHQAIDELREVANERLARNVSYSQTIETQAAELRRMHENNERRNKAMKRLEEMNARLRLQASRDDKFLLAMKDEIRDALDLRPFTDEEAERAYDEAEPVPLTEDQIAEFVKLAQSKTPPTEARDDE